MQEYHFRQVSCRFQGSFQAHQFSTENLCIVSISPLLLEKPASCTADGITVILDMIVVQDPLVLKAILLAKLIEFEAFLGAGIG